MRYFVRKNSLSLENGKGYYKDNHYISKIYNSKILLFSETDKESLANLRDSMFNISLVQNGINLIIMNY